MLPKWGVVWQTKDFVRDEVFRTRCAYRKHSLYVSNDTRSGRTVNQAVAMPNRCCLSLPVRYACGFFV